MAAASTSDIPASPSGAPPRRRAGRGVAAMSASIAASSASSSAGDVGRGLGEELHGRGEPRRRATRAPSSEPRSLATDGLELGCERGPRAAGVRPDRARARSSVRSRRALGGRLRPPAPRRPRPSRARARAASAIAASTAARARRERPSPSRRRGSPAACQRACAESEDRRRELVRGGQPVRLLLGLLREPARLRPELGEDVVDAGEIRLGLGELLLGPAPAALVPAHAGDLLEQRAALLRPQRERLVDHALADEQERVLREVAGVEQVDEVLEPDALPVEQVVVLAGSVQAPAELHDAVLDRQQAVAVVERQLDVGHARPPGRFSEPAQTTSSDLRVRSARPCSPSAQRRASARLLLPEPFGPTMALIPGPNSTWVRSAKDLKPWSRTERSRAGRAHGARPVPCRAPGRRPASCLRRPRVEHRDRLGRGRRLGDAPRRPDAHAEDLAADGDLDPEDLVVVRPDRLEHAVGRPAAAGRAGSPPGGGSSGS